MDATKIFESQPWLNDSLQNRRGIVRLASMGTKEKNMVVYITDDGALVLSATWQEILDAMAKGKNVVCVDKVDDTVYGVYPVVSIYYDSLAVGNKYLLDIYHDGFVTYSCSTANINPYYEL